MKKVLEFLAELKAHNHKEWMDANKPWYQETRKYFMEWVDELIAKMVEFDPSLAGVTAKDSMFRINRDVRFSKDKSPYKINLSAAIQEGGKKTMNPTYYLHIQPGENMIAGGMYMPPADILAKVRQEIDYNATELKDIVAEKKFSDTFGAISGDSLKTAPKGYPKDHPNIELLRLKSFLVVKNLSDKEVTSSDFSEKAAEYFKIMAPFNQYLSVAIS